MAKSALSSLVPLIILFFVIVIGAAVGLVVYSVANDIADKTSKKMEKHNVSFSKDGMKVGVKGKSAEQLGDDTQSVLMKVWNASSWPAYKSRFGWGDAVKSSPASTPIEEKRNPYARSSSTQNVKKASGQTSSGTPTQEKRNPYSRTISSQHTQKS